MSTEKMREGFESWTGARSDKGVWQIGERAGKYKNPVMQNKWEAWQASRAAIEVELPDRYDEGLWDGDGMVKTDGGLFIRVDDMAVSIKSLGLRVRP